MDILDFIATVVLLTASGALAPGPLFFQTISQGTKTGARSGLIFSIAHTIVEFSLIMLLTFGLLAVRNEVFIRNSIGFLGGIVLIIFSLFQIIGALRKFVLPKSFKIFNNIYQLAIKHNKILFVTFVLY